MTNTNKWIVDGNGYLFDESAVENMEDTLNKRKSIENYKKKTWETIKSCLGQKEYEKAFDKVRILFSYNRDASYAMLDVWAIQENEKMFLRG